VSCPHEFGMAELLQDVVTNSEDYERQLPPIPLSRPTLTWY
jgi:hypothetical protein